MKVMIEEMPAADVLRQALSEYRTDELGAPIALELVNAQARISVRATLAEFPLGEHDGVLVISARPHLAPGTALHSMLHLALDGRSIALFGIRQWRSDEVAIVRAKRIQTYSLIEISREGLAEMTDAVMSYVRTWGRFHVVLDLSVVDPAFAPGLSSPVPGGLTAREIIYVVQRLRLIRTLGSVHLLMDSSADPTTCRLASHLIAEFCAAVP